MFSLSLSIRYLIKIHISLKTSIETNSSSNLSKFLFLNIFRNNFHFTVFTIQFCGKRPFGFRPIDDLDPGVYICPYVIFPSTFSKMIFFPPSTVDISLFTRYSTSFPLYSRFVLKNHHIFTPTKQ